MNNLLKVGNKIMGFHYNKYGNNQFFAGTISEVLEQIILIIPLSAGFPTIIDINIDPIIEFNQEIYDTACQLQSEANNIQLRKEFKEMCIIRTLMKQPITETFEEYTMRR